MRVSVGDFRLGPEEKAAVNQVLDSGRLSEGKKVAEFERQFSSFIGVSNCVATSSGTGALICGLEALKHHPSKGIKPGSKILTTPLTYIATSNAIVVTGFEPVYVDVDPDRFIITPETVAERLEQSDSSDFSLVLPVHLMGYACDMDAINKTASNHGLSVFEDSAQAHGTLYKGRKTGSLSLLSDFSFYIAHNIQAGEMGCLVTGDAEIARLARKIKANGRMCDCLQCVRPEGKCPKLLSYKGEDDFDPRFTHDMVGYNFKTMEFQASLGLSQLKKADWIIKRRLENVKYLNDALSRFDDFIRLPVFDPHVSYLAYPLVVNPEKISRKKLRQELEKRGVETRPLFGCIPTQQPAYSSFKKNYLGKLPNAEFLGINAFYVGCHQYLEEKDLDFIAKCFTEILG